MGDPFNAHISVKNGPIMKILYFTESLLKFLNARSGLGPVFGPKGPESGLSEKQGFLSIPSFHVLGTKRPA